jgi:hypothetical protein
MCDIGRMWSKGQAHLIVVLALVLCCCGSCSNTRSDWKVQEYQNYYHRTYWHHAETNNSCANEIPGYLTTRRQGAQRNLRRKDGLRISFTERIPLHRLKSIKGFRPLRAIEGIAVPIFEELDVPYDDFIILNAFADDRIIAISISHLSASGGHEEAIAEAIQVFRRAYPQLAAQYWPVEKGTQP